MGVSSSHGTARSRRTRRTIWFTFAAMVAGPVACLVVLWGLILGGVLGGAMGGPDTPEHDHQVVVNFVVVIGIGLVIIVAGVALMGFFARRLARDITDLEATARYLADEEMPRLVERLRRGEQGVVPAEVTLQLRTKTAEVASAEAAIASLQHTAAAAAAGEAGLRNGIGQVFVSLARRNQSLLQRQLRLIDALEQKASDPATLADLFPLDHLTTRMRRHAEGLIILSGAAPGRSWSEPVPVIDVIRGAVAEIEDYKRVTVLTRAEDAVTGLAAADMIHLLAELIENATLSSPSGTRVEVRAERVANGFAIEIDDRGLGIEADQLHAINKRLAQPPDFDLANADQLGLFVVGKLAARHGVRVALRPSAYGGTTAVVLMPNSIVVRAADAGADTNPDLRPPIDRTSGLDLGDPGALAPAARQPAQPSFSAGPTGETGNADGGSGLASGSTGAALRPPGFAPRRPTFAPGTGTPGPAAGPQTAGTYRGLPRRVRQASLNPHLRDSRPAAVRGRQADRTPPSSTRSPEEARSLVASMQSGWRRGRATDAPGGESADAAQTARRQDSEAQHGEEA
ncbi:MAG TPA: ATP-binding protein [Streptosporangiaceae bacterium]|jgi:signal transduction histidine kinase|nr:ATP-binding protein [Streptosporangiaceae bacterium]